MSNLSNIARIRNFGIIAHIDAGKTTVSERILYYTHKIFRMGEVHDGNSTMDFMPEEQERGITISAASTFCEWENHALNFIDTPGHVDFTIEVGRSLRVLDGAVGVFCAVNGVEPQSETVWRQSEELAVPKLAFINKMDKVGADFEMVLTSMVEKLQANPILLQVPLYFTNDESHIDNAKFYAIADLIRFVKLEFDEDDDGETIIESELQDDEAVIAMLWREKMLESLADVDEKFLDVYIQEEWNQEDIKNALRRVCINQKAIPTLVGAARKNKGVQPLLDAICDFLPSPLEAKHVFNTQVKNNKIQIYSDPNLHPHTTQNTIQSEINSHTLQDTFCRQTNFCQQTNFYQQTNFSLDEKAFKALVFKIFPSFLDTKEQVALLRLYNGSLRKGMSCLNINQKEQANILQIYRLHADFYEEIEHAHLGEIVAITGFENIKTGDTLIAWQENIFSNMDFETELLETLLEYKPVITLTFEAKNQEESLILEKALTHYTIEDPTLQMQNNNTGNFIMSGMGELHLEILKERIAREYKIEPRTSKPQVVHCQSIKNNEHICVNSVFEQEINGKRQHADITITLSEIKSQTNNQISFSENWFNEESSFTKRGDVQNISNTQATFHLTPQNLQSIIKKSAQESLDTGSVYGHVLLGIEVTISSIKVQHNSTLESFYIATNKAIKEALILADKDNKLLLLEPIMFLEVIVPDENLSACINLINTSAGNVTHLTEKKGQKCIVANAPMRELFGFATRLRSVSQGRANLLMRFHNYKPV